MGWSARRAEEARDHADPGGSPQGATSEPAPRQHPERAGPEADRGQGREEEPTPTPGTTAAAASRQGLTHEGPRRRGPWCVCPSDQVVEPPGDLRRVDRDRCATVPSVTTPNPIAAALRAMRTPEAPLV